MSEFERVYILGSGAVGTTLAVHLLSQGRQVTLVRTSRDDVSQQNVDITLQESKNQKVTVPIERVSLSKLEAVSGIVVIAAKSYANEGIAARLKEKCSDSPVVIMQNGIGVEKPYLEAEFPEVYRCIVYITAQNIGENNYSYRIITSSPIGVIKGDEKSLIKIVETLDTPTFPFHTEPGIQREIWKKGIINSVFNSICPLLEIDNGIFRRNQDCAGLAKQIVRECIQVADRFKLDLSEEEIMQQIFSISERSDGQLISTLQDINNKRETEIESLNLEISRIAEELTPPLYLNTTKLLGKLVSLKSRSIM